MITSSSICINGYYHYFLSGIMLGLARNPELKEILPNPCSQEKLVRNLLIRWGLSLGLGSPFPPLSQDLLLGIFFHTDSV